MSELNLYPTRRRRELATEPCPRCGGPYFKGSEECDTCGLIFAKFDMRQTPKIVPGSARLENEWSLVLEQYGKVDIHLNFIRRCLDENNLPFAAFQYRRILDGNPNDEMAKRFQKTVVEVATLNYIPAKRPERREARAWNVSWILGTSGVAMSFAGAFFPPSVGINLLGVGILTLALTLGLRIWLPFLR